MRAIASCRTEVLGGHLEVCPCCAFQQPAYNSCRDRHCPKCQSSQQIEWVQERLKHILPAPHFHVVFTVPEALKEVALGHREKFYELLLRTAAQTLLELGHNPKYLGAELGVTTVLHTWTRDLRFHPHVHCIVTGGGLTRDGTRWRPVKGGYLFPVRVLSSLFRGKLMHAVEELWNVGEWRSKTLSSQRQFNQLKARLYQQPWVAYAKKPFGGPAQIFRYLGQYTHRVALSNHRLLALDDQGVRFITRGRTTVTLTADEFISRFLLHVLPRGFRKIRHYGLYAAGNVPTRLAAAQALFARRKRHFPVGLRLVALCFSVAFMSLPFHFGLGDWLDFFTANRCPRCGALLERRPLAAPPASAPTPSAPPLDSS